MTVAAFGSLFTTSLWHRLLATRSLRLVNTSRGFGRKAYPPTNLNGSPHVRHGNFISCRCKQMHSKPSGSSYSTFRERLGELRHNGTPEIVLGSIILGLAGIDYVLQVRNDNQRSDMYNQLEHEVRRDEATTREEDEKMLNEGVAAKSKFQCVIRRVPQNFDGHKCLKNVKLGDVVNVIEEGVGPGGQYNLCSVERDAPKKKAGDDSSGNEQRKSIGWFPCSCLQKIE